MSYKKTKSKNPVVTHGHLPQYKTLTFFGDSITVGAFDKEGMGGWVGRLSRLFADNSRNDCEFIFENKAACGNTTSHTLDDIRSAARKKLQSDLVIVNSGLNDAIIFGANARRCNLSHTKRMKAWSDIINIARKEKWPMLVVGLPGVQGDIVKIKASNGPIAYTIKMEEIEKYNRALGDLCSKRKVPFLSASGQWQKNKGKGLFSTDGFHLNDRGHQLLAMQVFRHIQEMEMI
jgi:lysophospholipase L1-like esterase